MVTVRLLPTSLQIKLCSAYVSNNSTELSPATLFCSNAGFPPLLCPIETHSYCLFPLSLPPAPLPTAERHQKTPVLASFLFPTSVLRTDSRHSEKHSFPEVTLSQEIVRCSKSEALSQTSLIFKSPLLPLLCHTGKSSQSRECIMTS